MPSAFHTGAHRPLALALHAMLATGLVLPTVSCWGAETTRVSVSSTGAKANNASLENSISADGRFVAFSSEASNLVAGDTNGLPDIFVRDRGTNQTTRVSVSSTGTQGNSYSYDPSISANGRFVAFSSKASTLVAGDTKGFSDIFVHDRATGQTARVSVDSAGVQANGSSYEPSVSADGRFVAFSSEASNLVAGDTNGKYDIFVHDRVTRQTTRVSVDGTGAESSGDYTRSPSISADGRFVAFQSDASTLVAEDTNGAKDIFVHDRTTGQTTRVSVSSAGDQSNGNYSDSESPSISADGRFVAFQSDATNLVAGDTNGVKDIFVHDRTNGQTTRISVNSSGSQSTGNYYGSKFPSISADGRFVAFASDAKNLVTGDTNEFPDIFVRDRTTGQTTRVSVSSTGAQSNYESDSPSISADGRFMAFESSANTLVAGDTNESPDIFVRDRLLNPAVTADLKITQTVSANPVVKGTTFRYTATVKNLGPATAGNVVLTDLAPLHGKVSLPPILTPSQGSCTKGPISICRLGTLTAGQQATVQVTFQALKASTVGNRVSVSAGPKDPTPLNNSVLTNTTISP
jgi:uncharacterized repeat protein (TIGR01451 family)